MGRIIWSYLCLYTHKMALESFTAAYGEGELHVWVKGYEKDYSHVCFSIFKCETANALSIQLKKL